MPVRPWRFPEELTIMPNSAEKKTPNNLETHNLVSLCELLFWHTILRSIWHNREPSEQRDSDLASFQDGA
jgi:hypothetical protein